MKTIYIDSDYKCHTNNDGTYRAVETDHFDEYGDAYIEGYRFVPEGEFWTRSDGVVFAGEMVAPWKSRSELEDAQREYERRRLAECEAALIKLGVVI